METYTVQQGDSLSLISKKFFGDFSKVKELQELNKIANADLIHPGQKLILPEGAAEIVDAEVVDENGNKIGWRSTLGRWLPWIIVAAAAGVLSYEAAKEKKKQKASKPVNGIRKRKTSKRK